MSSARIRLALAAAAATLLIACEQVVTDDNFQRITVGMTLGQVEDILGPGTSEESGGFGISSSGVITGSSTSNQRTYTWTEEQRTIVVVFEEGKVKSARKMGF